MTFELNKAKVCGNRFHPAPKHGKENFVFLGFCSGGEHGAEQKDGGK